MNYCKTYFFIETQHNKKKCHKMANFIPANTLIQINLKFKSKHYILDWDLVECLSFIEKPGSWI